MPGYLFGMAFALDGVMMIERDDYSLIDAAKRLNCTVDDVIHLATIGKIQLIVLTYGLPAIRRMRTGDPLTGQIEPITSRYCLVESDQVARFETIKANGNLRDASLSCFPCLDDSEDHWEIAFQKDYIEMTNQSLRVLAKSIKPFELSSQQKQICQAEYLNTSHPMYSKELATAIEAWQAVLSNNPPRPKSGSRKKLIEDYLRTNHRLDESAISRISTMLNPDKTGGAPKSE